MRKNTFIELVKEARFRELFITEMGWNNYRGQSEVPMIEIDDTSYQLFTIAERNGFQILTCEVESIPTATLCKRIDVKLRRSANDYIAIYIEKGSEHHQWVAPVRHAEKRELVTVEYENAQKADFLFSKIDGLSFDNNEHTTIVDVKERIQETFSLNSEKITKDFYAGFKKEHDAFEKFITGIDDHLDDVKGNEKKVQNRNKQWYASVMLNRLMFCYFIQKKGFLDGNVNYLSDKLKWCQEEKGNNHFFCSFYKGFLLQLFQDGLNSPTHESEFEKVYGKIPYLNGGMFDSHQIERDYDNIDIADEAFERLFAFFDKWRWHLDTRISASGKDINPDVLGYIFEQYINDRAQMGAYYTKEDITEYIGRNCIVPFLMDKVQHSTQEMEKAFNVDGIVWTALKNSGDKYIFNAVKHGYCSDWKTRIPNNISIGLDTKQPNLLERRKDWNIKTAEPWALPTEIWRETIERLQRCEDILSKINQGEIHEINDFITYNLDIRSFVGDLLAETDNHKFVGHFYHALQQVTILDPTCGSGAFLFAAMNILEPLYEICIDRMMEWNQQNSNLFKEEIAEIQNRYCSNIQYFIYKSIILRNLYGVDIMQEATEIAKLRLFLKMVAVVEVNRRAPNLGLDPLPDVDFNIRCGNTLVGYATENEILAGSNTDIFTQQEFREQVETEMQKVSKTYEIFRTQQLADQNDLLLVKNAKQELKRRLATLTDLLDHQLYSSTGSKSFDEWKKSHQPFHWIAEYYQIIQGNGGFDVIIGNPPYVEYSKIRKRYQVTNIKCIDSGNLYAFVIERSFKVSHLASRNGMIIQMSAFCTPRMKSFQNIWFENAQYSSIAFFDDRPGKLFENLQHIRVVIPIIEIGKPNKTIATTGYSKFYSLCRQNIFQLISYYLSDFSRKDFSVLKIRTKQEENIALKVWANHKTIASYENSTPNDNFVYYGYGYGYFGKILNYKSYFYGEQVTESTGDKYYYIKNEYNKDIFTGIMNSSLFYWFYINYSDGHNFTKTVIGSLPFDYFNSNNLIQKVSELMIDLGKKKGRKKCTYKSTGYVEYDEYYPKLSKKIIDEIDTILAEYYGFSEEELDFIINYDIKYRMGNELNNTED